ncbi:hypothetical protein K378_01431 [Streptomyces sp. Amel2xB2]|nr:hypothetical protein K378_01431 [Streptomyces sp. Amel2xB2]
MGYTKEYELRMMSIDGGWIVRGHYADPEQAMKDMCRE